MNQRLCKNCEHCDMNRMNDVFEVRCKLRHEWVGVNCTCKKHEWKKEGISDENQGY